MKIIVEQTDGNWPSLRQWAGSEVMAIQIHTDTGALILHLSKCEVHIPPPWTFTSCMQAVTSTDCGRDATTLVGLQGAILTDVESGSNGLDLVFGAIRVSVGS